jgi:hypothetical protein
MSGFSEEKPSNLLIDKMIEALPYFLRWVYVGKAHRFIIFEIDQSYVL